MREIFEGIMMTQIVDHAQVQKIIRRMAYQIYERNFNLKEIVFAAIDGQGAEVARLLGEELSGISSIKVQQVVIRIDKQQPEIDSILIEPPLKLTGKTVLLVDDVLNTGRTLVYSMVPFLKAGVKSLQVAVLVDRNHNSFPVDADYKGVSLQTTLQEHVSVVMKSKKINVFLE